MTIVSEGLHRQQIMILTGCQDQHYGHIRARDYCGASRVPRRGMARSEAPRGALHTENANLSGCHRLRRGILTTTNLTGQEAVDTLTQRLNWLARPELHLDAQTQSVSSAVHDTQYLHNEDISYAVDAFVCPPAATPAHLAGVSNNYASCSVHFGGARGLQGVSHLLEI